MEEQTKTRQLQGITDLTLLAPIKRGFIDGIDSRTYLSRLKVLLRTLNAARLSSREYSLIRPFSDTAERIRTIHSLRLAILEPEHKLLLAVTFDRPWEPYIRIIWSDVGALLDVIFCNCDGYVTARDHSFAEYAHWVRSAQIEAGFFFNATPASVDDVQYLRETERLQRERPASSATDLASVRLVVPDPVAAAKAVATAPQNRIETVKQGMQALAVLYRLVDLYPPTSADGVVLLRAAQDLLRELREPGVVPLYAPGTDAYRRFSAQIHWFETPLPIAPGVPTGDVSVDWADVQGGMRSKYDGVSQGCLLLIGLIGGAPEARVAGARFLASLRQNGITTESQVAPQAGRPTPGGPTLNIAFTPAGLRMLGLSEAQLDEFPPEFLEGMESRAGQLGDTQGNHPRQWALPERNWPAPATAGAPVQRVQMSMVHIVLQLFARTPLVVQGAAATERPGPLEPWAETVAQLVATHPGVQVLSVQIMRRHSQEPGSEARDHFGFVDGISQPELGDPGSAPTWNNRIATGELLLGHPNGHGDPPAANALLHNGSFLVLRKLRQDVAGLNASLARAAQATGLSVDVLKAKMMGRTLGGDPLASPGAGNAFDYSADPQGSRCPFHAHVRRANPRHAGGPRIVRRGMSYGPRFDDTAAPADAERGLIFMAYNASIAEQFETIQRWISGANSSGAYSAPSDPFLGVPQVGNPRTYRFEHQGKVVRVDLDDPTAPRPKPFVQLEWGAYLFVPSMKALAELQRIARAGTQARRPARTDLELGERLIHHLLELERQVGAGTAGLWKELLEDSSSRTDGRAAAVWAAIRERRGGALRTPYGVLVCSKTLVTQVLTDASRVYSVQGYRQRLLASIGEIYLGLDAGPAYAAQSSAMNRAIEAVSEQQAFDLALSCAQKVLAVFVAGADKLASAGAGELTFDIKEVTEPVLAALCSAWFDLPGDGTHVQPGGWRWDWREDEAPLCPGHFTAPSRYLFQPNPGRAAQDAGQSHGRALRDAVKRMVEAHRAAQTLPRGSLARAAFEAFPSNDDNDLLARTLVGVMMGFLPTVDGNLRSTLNEWLEDRSFWELQNRYAAHPGPHAFARAQDVIDGPLRRSMQLRPVPEMVWRTAVRAHRLGPLEVRRDDLVVVGLVSATHQDLDHGVTDASLVFGGDRRTDPYPSHACPGATMALGVMLGVLAALMEVGPLRPTPVPLSLSLQGRPLSRLSPG